MGRKTPPWPDYPTWTTARFWSFVRSGFRSKFNVWPPKYECLKAAQRTVEGKRHKNEFQCAICKDWYMQKEVEVDHIIPAGSLNNYDDLVGFVQRLFVPKNGLQVVCKTCHRAKTKKENAK